MIEYVINILLGMGYEYARYVQQESGELYRIYYAYYEESDEAVGFIGGWRVEILGVRGIVESEHLVGGVIELKIENFDEQSIINEIINKL